jgi:maltose O-acetyltransferase
MNQKLIQRSKNIIKRILFIKTLSKIEELKSKGLKVGDNFQMQHGCEIDFSHCWHIEIGNDVLLAPNVHILAHDASTWWFLGYSKIKNVVIGNKVFIGAGSIIMPGVTIGDNVIVGAGSVVTKDIPSDCVHAGNPAKFITHTHLYIAQEKQKMNAENCFDSSFSESENVSDEKKALIKRMAQKHGTAFAE